ncbi:hypothetical protein TSUD_101010 [Trifolium subterraneum]|uniref:Uncharacterized protein n=1 Tax=Trifolium subterraneum TaxID=3900 RepID=A0A2Z6PCY7_TRISU|nr:hypothetical protein TSUD_101010 [Trifolium subterraneum]
MASNPNCGQCLRINQYTIPSDNLPTRRMFEDDNRKILIRQHAVSVIAKVKELVKKMIQLCHRMIILIDKIEVAADEIEAEEQSLAKDKGKGMAVIKKPPPQPQMEGAISATQPTEHMNFKLNFAQNLHFRLSQTLIHAVVFSI